MNQTLTKISTGKWYYIADIHVEDGYFDDRRDIVGKKVKFDNLNARDPMYEVQSPDGNALIDCYYFAGRGRTADGDMKFFIGVALTETKPNKFIEAYKPKPKQETNYEW